MGNDNHKTARLRWGEGWTAAEDKLVKTLAVPEVMCRTGRTRYAVYCRRFALGVTGVPGRLNTPRPMAREKRYPMTKRGMGREALPMMKRGVVVFIPATRTRSHAAVS